MSQALLLLTLSVVAFPSLDSFVLAPAKNSAAWFNQRGEHVSSSHSSSSSIFRSGERRAVSSPLRSPLAVVRAAASGASGDSSQQKPGQSVRKKTKRPRKHIPVDDGDSSGVAGGGGAGLPGDPSDPFLNLVSPMEYASLDSSAGSSSADPSPSSSKASSSSSSSSSSFESPLPEPSFRDRQRFGRIMEDVLAEEKEEELPAILTKHVDFLLSVDVTSLTNDLIRQEPTMDRVNTLRNAYEFIVTFLETMVESTVDVQKENQTLLRLIIEAAKTSPDVFEKRMKKLQDRFTFEFVKYLDAEVERLEKVEKDLAEQQKKRREEEGEEAADVNSPIVGGNEVLNVIRIVRSRVCAQLDLMMGEDVAVLTRMLSYDDRFMMRAALRTVLRDKTPKEVAAFGILVSRTLDDVVALGSGVDPVLRSKLQDMAEDIASVGRDVEERQKDKLEREAEEAGQA